MINNFIKELEKQDFYKNIKKEETKERIKALAITAFSIKVSEIICENIANELDKYIEEKRKYSNEEQLHNKKKK